MDPQEATDAHSTPDKPSRRPVPVEYDPSYDPRSYTVAPKHVRHVVGFSEVTAWRLRKRGLFPEPVRLSPGRVGWLRSDLEKWLAEQQAST